MIYGEIMIIYVFSNMTEYHISSIYLSVQVEFEDHRIKDFAAFKASDKAPYGQCPTMDVDGTVIAQTGPIARYCGKLGGLYPRDDDLAAAKIDEIIDVATDMTNFIAPTMRMPAEEKVETRKKVFAEKMPNYFENLEKILAGNDSGFFVGKTMTIADIAIWKLMGWFTGGALDGVPTSVIDGYPNLVKHSQLIGANEKIKAWMDSHYSKK